MTSSSPSRASERRSLRRPAAGRIIALAALLLVPAFADGQDISNPRPLRTEDGSLLGVVDSVHSSIITVVGYPPAPATERAGAKRKRLIGTAIAFSERQLITTASIAVPGGTVRVLLGGGVERPATIVGVDRSSNVALLRVEGAKLRPLQPAPPQSLASGAWVAVISNIAITRPQAALGQIVGRGERIDYPHGGEILEIDSPSYPGSTGGAVLNEEGDWVAVVVGRAVPGASGGGSRVDIGRGEPIPDPSSVLIALPVEQVAWLAKELETYGSVRHGFLGVQLRRGNPASSESLGVLVASVIADSPADSAGLRAGDRILAIQGQEARTADELTAFVRATRPGEMVEVTVLRQSEIFPLRVTVGAAFNQPPVGPRPTKSADVSRMKRELERLQAEQRRLEEQLRALEETPQR